jgi:hypothetical protein
VTGAGIALNEHYEGNGAIIYERACRFGCSRMGIVQRRIRRYGVGRRKKPEGRACASPPLTFSATATVAGTKINLARRDAR